jgi:RNA polymerase sigma factor (sigma-70 family)
MTGSDMKVALSSPPRCDEEAMRTLQQAGGVSREVVNEVFSYLVSKYHVKLLKKAEVGWDGVRVTDALDREDAEAETWKEVFVRMRSFRWESQPAFEAWLFTVFKSKCMDVLRRSQANQRVLTIESPPPWLRATCYGDADGECVISEGHGTDEWGRKKQMLKTQILSRFRPGTSVRHVLERLLAGVDVPAIASEMGMSEARVRSIRAKAVRRLADLESKVFPV